MLYRKMEKTGDELSVLGFGAMRLPGSKMGKIDEERATKQIRHAVDQGVNYIDTAMPYHMGASEPFLAKALGDGYRDKVKLATKLPPWSVREPGDMDKLLNAQLKRLSTDRIDYYLIHALDRKSWDKMKPMGVADFLDRAKKDGRIGHAGYSFHGDKDVFKQIVDGCDWDFCQLQYNYLDEKNQAGKEGLVYAAAKGMGVVVMEPLRGGNLSRRVPEAVQEIFDRAPIKRTPAEWALRWVWNHPEVSVVLSGMNREAHIDENLRIADEALPNSLTAPELGIIDEVKKTYKRLMKAGCTSCRYCMPCPHGVDIPACFESYNSLSLFNDRAGSKVMYIARVGGLAPEEAAYASLCEECGECEEKCPQKLPIKDLLKDVASSFETRSFKPMLWTVRKMMKLQTWWTLRKS